jgi:hypothetical protein
MPPIPPARGGNATPVPVPPHVTPKRRKPKPRVPLPPPPGRTAAAPPSASPYPQYPFPRIYNPAVVASRAQSAAQDAINQQLAAGMSTLPTVQQQSAPYQQQIASEQGLGQSLLDALKGAQTYRVDLATGVPQAFSAEAAATGGDQSTAARAAATLASYGTSAANQIAQQEATAPAATASNTRIIQQRLQDLLSGPQGHDALARQLSSPDRAEPSRARAVVLELVHPAGAGPVPGSLAARDGEHELRPRAADVRVERARTRRVHSDVPSAAARVAAADERSEPRSS